MMIEEIDPIGSKLTPATRKRLHRSKPSYLCRSSCSLRAWAAQAGFLSSVPPWWH
jgi:hypothetical protein